MNGDNGKTRYHAEIKVSILQHEARVNIFADTLAEVFQDIATIINQYPGNLGPARREVANAELKRDQLPLTPSPHETPGPPVCDECGSAEYMELISFPDKKTGKPRQAWKCQQCQKWHWENGKGR